MSVSDDPPQLNGWPMVFALLALFAMSAAAGWLFERIGAPLPWMIGPLIVTAAVFMGFAPRTRVPAKLRPVGQIVVATQVGLAFSPAAFALLVQLAPVILGTVLLTIGCIFVTAFVIARLTGQGLAQAFLSAAPTSPVEAANMASAAGIDPMPVILSQAIRLAAVVILVPFTLYAIDGWPEISRHPTTLDITDPSAVLILGAIGVAAARAFQLMRIPNPNFLGPMTVAAILSASGFGLGPYPPVVLAVAQIILGTWLGATFRRNIVTSAIRLTLVSLASALLLLMLSSLCALGIAALSEVDWRTLVLGAAPGGVVEMALTAKFLQQNVVLITTFHLVRIFIFMPNIPWIVRRFARRDAAKKGYIQ